MKLKIWENFNFIIGVNGSGKSTLFLNMNGVLKATKGEIYFKDKKIAYDKKSLMELRKNRTGDAMEDLVESYIVKAGFIKDHNYYKEVASPVLKEKWDIDLEEILKNIDNTTKNKKVKMAKKRFDCK